MTHELENIYDFVDNHVKGPWTQRGQEMVLYRHPEERFVVRRETAASHVSLWRHDVLAEAGIYDAKIDAEEFGRRFMETVGDNLSPYDIIHLIKHMQAYIDGWNAVRVRNGHPPLTIDNADQ